MRVNIEFPEERLPTSVAVTSNGIRKLGEDHFFYYSSGYVWHKGRDQEYWHKEVSYVNLVIAYRKLK